MSGLFSLLDDVAALAKLAATTLDDVAAATGKASIKAAGVIVDDTAVTPQYLKNVSPERELPIIKKIALGSLRNKILIILPIALLLSQIAPFLIPFLMILGGSFLAFEGIEKVFEKFLHNHPASPKNYSNSHNIAQNIPSKNNTHSAIKNDIENNNSHSADSPSDKEEKVIRDAVRTDLILSAEIMVIALNEVAAQGIAARTIILIIVALIITFLVYGTVALIVKIDDFGLLLTRRRMRSTQKIGILIIRIMPKILALISIVGVFAMVWVGGHIVVLSCADLGWHLPHHLIEHTVFWAGNIAGNLNFAKAILITFTETLASFIAGALWGTILVIVFLGSKKIIKNFYTPTN